MPTSAASLASSPRPRLDYLDGLRGLAALYVVLGHAYQIHFTVVLRGEGKELSRLLLHATNWLSFGQVAVDIFIVLSGYCLMLPVAKSANGELRGGITGFIKRRAKRILIPYYITVGFALCIIALVPGMNLRQMRLWDNALPALTPPSLLSHLFVVHNLSLAWRWKFDPPLWSVATEWQIYLIFGLLLLPLWRRFGAWVTTAFALLLGLALQALLHHKIDQACPWFIGLFALGMLGAAIGFSPHDDMKRLRKSLPSGAMALALTGVFWIASIFKAGWLFDHYAVMDTLVGVTTVCLLIFCTRSLTEMPHDKRPAVLRLLESRPCVVLGTFSYSLYLAHYPILCLLDLALKPLRMGTVTTLFVMLSVGTLLSLGVSYLFHLAFERPFMPGHPRTERQAEQAAITSPAP